MQQHLYDPLLWVTNIRTDCIFLTLKRIWSLVVIFTEVPCWISDMRQRTSLILGEFMLSPLGTSLYAIWLSLSLLCSLSIHDFTLVIKLKRHLRSLHVTLSLSSTTPTCFLALPRPRTNLIFSSWIHSIVVLHVNTSFRFWILSALNGCCCVRINQARFLKPLCEPCIAFVVLIVRRVSFISLYFPYVYVYSFIAVIIAFKKVDRTILNHAILTEWLISLPCYLILLFTKLAPFTVSTLYTVPSSLKTFFNKIRLFCWNAWIHIYMNLFIVLVILHWHWLYFKLCVSSSSFFNLRLLGTRYY